MEEYFFHDTPQPITINNSNVVDVEAQLSSLLQDSSTLPPFDFSSSPLVHSVNGLSAAAALSLSPPVSLHHPTSSLPPASALPPGEFSAQGPFTHTIVQHPPTMLIPPQDYAQQSQLPAPSPSPSALVPSTTTFSPSTLAPSSSTLASPSFASSALDTKRKRRRKDDNIVPDEMLKGFDWMNYQSPNPSFIVFDFSGRPLSDQFDVAVFKSGTNTHYSAADKAWICYRQNQFKVFCLLKSPPPCPMYVRDGASSIEIVQFYAKLYAIKASPSTPSSSSSPTSPNNTNSPIPLPSGDELLVGLVHVGRSRVKKEKTEISPIPFMDGRAEFSNLQFERSNAIKGPPEHFHLVVSLFAKTANAYYLILSRISPRIIVRSQHPGFYGQQKSDNTPSPTETTPSPPQLDQTDQKPLSQNTSFASNYTSNTSSEDGASPNPNLTDSDGVWQQSGDGVFHMGKVGINTSEPTEALTVHGNALITGNLYKPSDRRIKSDITKVDTGQQLDHIRQLQMYDYTVRNTNERGVLAQELEVVLPNAVHHAGDVEIDGKQVKDFLVVNERVLLYENIGATQQLDKDLENEKKNIIQIDSQVRQLTDAQKQQEAEMRSHVKSLSDLLFAEEITKDEMGMVGLKEEHVAFGLNLFRMGPARSILILGYFFPWLWMYGAIFMFSSIPARRTLGKACLSKFVIFWLVYTMAPYADRNIRLIYGAIGLILLVGNYRRNCRRIEIENNPSLLTNPPPPTPCVPGNFIKKTKETFWHAIDVMTTWGMKEKQYARQTQREKEREEKRKAKEEREREKAMEKERKRRAKERAKEEKMREKEERKPLMMEEGVR